MQLKSGKLSNGATLGKPRGKEKFQKRYNQALSPSQFLANIIHPKYRQKNLTDDEYGTGMDLATKQHAKVIPNLVNYKAEAPSFQSFMFQQNVIENVKPLYWWNSQADRFESRNYICCQPTADCNSFICWS